MFTEIDAYLRYFDSAHRRTVRDILALGAGAEDYRPETGEGENAWGITDIVRHMAGSRLYFSRAYRGEGWVFDGPLRAVNSREDWVPVLEESAVEFRQAAGGDAS